MDYLNFPAYLLLLFTLICFSQKFRYCWRKQQLFYTQKIKNKHFSTWRSLFLQRYKQSPIFFCTTGNLKNILTTICR